MSDEKRNLHTMATPPGGPVPPAAYTGASMHPLVSHALSASSLPPAQEPYHAHQPTPMAFNEKGPSQLNQPQAPGFPQTNFEQNPAPTPMMMPAQAEAHQYANSPHQAPGPGPLSQQPGATPSMQPTGNAQAHQFDADGNREWSHGLCGCFSDCGTCFLACCCPCIVYGQNVTRAEHLKTNHGQPHPTGGESCGSDALLHGLLTACCAAGWVLQIGSRGKLRDRHRIKGSVVGDLFASWCCNPCALTQESREIALEESQMQRGNILGGQ